MKKRTKFKIADWMMILGLLFWFLETWYFGWNDTPINEYELWLDRTFLWIITLGFLFYLSEALIYFRHKIIEREELQYESTSINTDLALYGVSYIEIKHDKKGKIISTVVDPRNVRIKTGPNE